MRRIATLLLLENVDCLSIIYHSQHCYIINTSTTDVSAWYFSGHYKMEDHQKTSGYIHVYTVHE